jgi:hypothetical protein
MGVGVVKALPEINADFGDQLGTGRTESRLKPFYGEPLASVRVALTTSS